MTAITFTRPRSAYSLGSKIGPEDRHSVTHQQRQHALNSDERSTTMSAGVLFFLGAAVLITVVVVAITLINKYAD